MPIASDESRFGHTGNSSIPVFITSSRAVEIRTAEVQFNASGPTFPTPTLSSLEYATRMTTLAIDDFLG